MDKLERLGQVANECLAAYFGVKAGLTLQECVKNIRMKLIEVDNLAHGSNPELRLIYPGHVGFDRVALPPHSPLKNTLQINDLYGRAMFYVVPAGKCLAINGDARMRYHEESMPAQTFRSRDPMIVQLPTKSSRNFNSLSPELQNMIFEASAKAATHPDNLLLLNKTLRDTFRELVTLHGTYRAPFSLNIGIASERMGASKRFKLQHPGSSRTGIKGILAVARSIKRGGTPSKFDCYADKIVIVLEDVRYLSTWSLSELLWMLTELLPHVDANTPRDLQKFQIRSITFDVKDGDINFRSTQAKQLFLQFFDAIASRAASLAAASQADLPAIPRRTYRDEMFALICRSSHLPDVSHPAHVAFTKYRKWRSTPQAQYTDEENGSWFGAANANSTFLG